METAAGAAVVRAVVAHVLKEAGDSVEALVRSAKVSCVDRAYNGSCSTVSALFVDGNELNTVCAFPGCVFIIGILVYNVCGMNCVVDTLKRCTVKIG